MVVDAIDALLINISNSISINKEYFINITSIITQMIIGCLIYFGMLIVLKDDYVFKFIDKIKTKLFKKKEVEQN